VFCDEWRVVGEGLWAALGKWWSGGGDSFSKTKIILAECDEW